MPHTEKTPARRDGPWLVLLVICLVPFFSGCAEEMAPAPAETQNRPPHLVETAPVERRDLAINNTYAGTLRARRTVRIFAREAGRTTEVPHFEGDRVNQGALVASIDDALLQAQWVKAQALRRQSEADLRRIERLVSDGLVSQDELARKETALEVARAEERILSIRLSYTRMTAPFDAVVTERLVEPGDLVAANDHLLTLSDPSSLITQVSVSELLLPHVRRGDAVRVRIDALGSGTHAGEIIRIHPSVDPLTRRGTLEVALTKVPEGAYAGQFCRVEIAVEGATRLVLPIAAVQRDRAGEFAYLLRDDGQVHRVGVTTGLRLARSVEILSGLEAGDRVVIRGFLGLSDGKAVSAMSGQS